MSSVSENECDQLTVILNHVNVSNDYRDYTIDVKYDADRSDRFTFTLINKDTRKTVASGSDKSLLAAFILMEHGFEFYLTHNTVKKYPSNDSVVSRLLKYASFAAVGCWIFLLLAAVVLLCIKLTGL